MKHAVLGPGGVVFDKYGRSGVLCTLAQGLAAKGLNQECLHLVQRAGVATTALGSIAERLHAMLKASILMRLAVASSNSMPPLIGFARRFANWW